MTQNERATLLLEGTVPTTDWNAIGEPGQIVRVPSFRLLDGAVATGMGDLGIEIEGIVIDRAIDEEQLLEFLCHMMAGFRGAVLAIMTDGSAYVSTMSRGDGRHLYLLGNDDDPFYMFARFGLTGAVCTPRTETEH
jgi:hypothetical protein